MRFLPALLALVLSGSALSASAPAPEKAEKPEE